MKTLTLEELKSELPKRLFTCTENYLGRGSLRFGELNNANYGEIIVNSGYEPSHLYTLYDIDGKNIIEINGVAFAITEVVVMEDRREINYFMCEKTGNGYIAFHRM